MKIFLNNEVIRMRNNKDLNTSGNILECIVEDGEEDVSDEVLDLEVGETFSKMSFHKIKRNKRNLK